MTPKRFSLVLIGLIVAMACLVIATFGYGQKLLSQRATKLQRLSGDIQLETEQIQRLRELESSYQQVAPLANKVQTILPSQKQQAEIVALVAAIVEGSGLPLNGISFDPTQGLPSNLSQTKSGSVSGILEMPISFESTGSYNKLQTLLKSLEKQQRYIQVNTLDITRSATNVLNFNITLRVFVKP